MAQNLFLSMPIPSKQFVTNFMPLADLSRTLVKCTGSFMDSVLIFLTFSTAQITLTSLPCSIDLISKAESLELFQRSLESSDFTPTIFAATNRGRTHGSHPASFSDQRGCSHFHKNNSFNRGQTHLG